MIAIHTAASIQKTVTENARVPGGTSNFSPFAAWYIAAIDQATPIPRKTFTALLPVTLPIEESAYLSLTAATLLANVSEKDNTCICICNKGKWCLCMGNN